MEENKSKEETLRVENKIKKRKYILEKFIYKPAVAILAIQCVAVGLFYYDHRGRINHKIDTLVDIAKLSFDTLETGDYLQYFGDLFRAIFSVRQLERLDLSLSFKDRKKLECMRKRLDDCSKDGWVRAELFHNKERYPIKIRAKGDRDIHRISFNKMSFKVDIRGENRLFGMEEFSIQSPMIRNYTFELMAAKAFRSENIAAPRNAYIRLYVNGQYLGVRHIEEAISKELVESSQKRYGPVYGLNERAGSKVYEEALFELSDKNQWSKSTVSLHRKGLSILRASQDDPKVFKTYFDNTKWARFIAMLDTLHMYHGAHPKSVKYYLNPTKGLIEPLFFDGHHFYGIWGRDFRFSDFLTTDKLLADKCKWICSDTNFFRMMFGEASNINKEFYIEYFKSLERFTSKDYIEAVFEKEWNNLWLERGTIYREGFKRDGMEGPSLLPHVGSFMKLKKRFSRIRDELTTAKLSTPIHSYSKSNNIISLLNKQSRFPQIYSIYCNNDQLIDTYILIKDLKKDIPTISPSICTFKNLKFSIDNGKSKYFIKNLEIDDSDFQVKIPSTINKAIGQGKSYIFENHKSSIDKDIFIKNKHVLLKDSVNICLRNSSVLYITKSNVIIEGTKDKPVIVKGCDGTNGSIVIDNSTVSLGYLKVNNLRAPDLELMSLYGGINFIDSKVYGNELVIENALSEDAINIIGSTFEIDNIDFRIISSDALDSDFSKLSINSLNCQNIGNDCVDLSYSQGYINILTSTEVKDKVISLGEQSTLELNSVNISNSEIGLVAKDDSILNINSYEYNNVKIPLSAYRKKYEFDSPELYVNKISNNDFTIQFISDDAIVKVGDMKIKGLTSSKEINDKFYGEIYGVKTIRQ